MSTYHETLSVMSEDCEGCNINNYYDRESGEAEEIWTELPETYYEYDHNVNGEDFKKSQDVKYTVNGPVLKDTITFVPPAGKDEQSLNLEFMLINSITPAYDDEENDGFIGIAPGGNNYLEQKNFIHQLKNDGFIDNLIISIYLDSKSTRSGHIKFGGWDTEGMAEGNELQLLRTQSKTTFGVGFSEFTFGGSPITLNSGNPQTVLMDPGYPYMYIPYNDFYKITGPINKIFNTFAGANRRGYACYDQAGNCFMDASCEDVRAAVT